MKFENSRQFFETYSNMKFHGNMPSGSRAILCGLTDERTDGQSDMTKLIIAFSNFANAPKQYKHFSNFLKMVIRMCSATEYNKRSQSIFQISLLTKEKFRIMLLCQFVCTKLIGRYVASPLFTIWHKT